MPDPSNHRAGPATSPDRLDVPERSVLLPPKSRRSWLPLWLLLVVACVGGGWAWLGRSTPTPQAEPATATAAASADTASSADAAAPPAQAVPASAPASTSSPAPVAAAPMRTTPHRHASHARPPAAEHDKRPDKASAEAARIRALQRSLPPPELPPADESRPTAPRP